MSLPELKEKLNFIGKISSFFIKNLSMLILIVLFIVIFGVFGLVSVPRESLPEIVIPNLIISGSVPGSGAQDIENSYVKKIEDELSELQDLESISSTVEYGRFTIFLEIDNGDEISLRRLEAENLVNRIDDVDDIRGLRVDLFRTSRIPLMEISISGDYESYQMSNYAETISDEIKKIADIDDVSIEGDSEREAEILVDHIKMYDYGITYDNLSFAIKNNNIELPIDNIDLNGTRYSMRIDMAYKNLDELKHIMVPGRDGHLYFLDQFATVSIKETDEKTSNRTYSKDKEISNSVFLKVLRKEESDVIGTSETLKRSIESLRGNEFPEDLKIVYFNDMSLDVEEDLSDIWSSAISGLVVVIVVLFLFIGFSEAAIVSISIPLSILGVLGIISFLGITLNTFAILGLIVSLGLLVDNSIIVMENIDRIRKLDIDTRTASIYGTNQVSVSILASTLTTIGAFFPLAILPGTLGDFVSTIPKVIILTLICSFIVSVVITPAISSRLLGAGKYKPGLFIKIILVTLIGLIINWVISGGKGYSTVSITMAGLFVILFSIKFIRKKSGENPILRYYKRFITKLLSSKKLMALTIILGLLLFFGSFGAFSSGFLKVSFFPANEPDSVVINMELAKGSVEEDSRKLVEEIEKTLVSIVGIERFNITYGGEDPSQGQIYVEFSSGDGYEILGNIIDEFSNIAGASFIINQESSGPPVSKPIGLKIYGNGLDTINEVAREYIEVFNSIEGVYNMQSSSGFGIPQIVIDIDREKARYYGFEIRDIYEQLLAQIKGIDGGSITISGEEIDISLKSDIENIGVDNMKYVYVKNKNGEIYPLGHFVKIVDQGSISSIQREDSKRYVEITGDLERGYNINDIISEFRRKIEGDFLPEDVLIKYEGDIQGIEDSFLDLFRSMILAVFIIFFILVLQFKSLLQPFVILFTLPMAIIGVIWGLALTGNDFGFYGFMGLVALSGIAVNDAIVLIDYSNFLKLKGSSTSNPMIEAAYTRFNPVFATSLTTICGILPLALKNIYYAQFGFALVFGLLVTTLMTLIYIPIAYTIVERIRR
ncbi:MAG: efflux RND transporter permease subunit [Firmicutes bacterium]|jgi:HAE1 family hydrophobic/amphiphilic exporter-1|nr:efflux RND transporter permease subunit [Bacillota bacterium]